MQEPADPTPSKSTIEPNLGKDFLAGIVVFLVALPLCLGIALASNAPLISGIISGIIGGLIIGPLSGSHTSVSGPAAALATTVVAQLAILGSFETFLVAVVLAGLMQLLLGVIQAGTLSAFVPTSVIKGLLAAIGVVLILKQIPHMVGHDSDPEGDLAFEQADEQTTLETLVDVFLHPMDWHLGATTIGFVSLILLVLFARWEPLKKSGMPAPLVVVTIGLIMSTVFNTLGDPWMVTGSHLVEVPDAGGITGFAKLLRFPNFSAILNGDVWIAAATIAAVASLATLLNLEAVDRLDPAQRKSPPNRELMAQGVGNIIAGMIGGIPITSVIIRGSVNIQTGATTKRSAIIHGFFLVGMVLFMAGLLNRIPLSCLAAILLFTGFKLVSPEVIKKMWSAGWDQFVPFMVTVSAIVLYKLLEGLGIGMAVALLFILYRQFRRPVRRIVEQHLAGEVLHIELPDQVTFLNQVAIEKVLADIPRDSAAMLDARHTEYIDPDVLALLEDFRDVQAPARNIELTMVGFADEYDDTGEETIVVDYSARELRGDSTVAQVFDMIWAGHQRFASGKAINREYTPLMTGAGEPTPLVAVLSCVDDGVPAELLFDMPPHDVLDVSVVGAAVSPGVLGSLEYVGVVEGVRLIVVLGHTGSRVFESAAEGEAGGARLGELLADLRETGALEPAALAGLEEGARAKALDAAMRRSVVRMVQRIAADSATLAKLADDGRLGIVGAIHDVETDAVEFLVHEAVGFESGETSMASLM